MACVIGEETGVVVCWTSRGVLRASWGGALLAAVARDRSAAPARGDWVLLREWSDHRVTVDRVLGASVADRHDATVVPLRRPG